MTASNIPAAEQHFAERPDWHGYLQRMSKPLQEKLKMARYIPANATHFLDVGCADGTVTMALAEMFPHIQFLGIDLDRKFIDLANEHAQERGLKNVRFRCVYLRQLLEEPQRFHVVQFMSVDHEFWSYGEGISSVVKAKADAHELLFVGGRIFTRDMIASRFSQTSTFRVDTMRAKILAGAKPHMVRDFVELYGELDNLCNINHFLLKYMYEENWKLELRENYLAVFVEDHDAIYRLLEMQKLVDVASRIPYLNNKWVEDFGLDEVEREQLVTTRIIVAEKVISHPARFRTR